MRGAEMPRTLNDADAERYAAFIERRVRWVEGQLACPSEHLEARTYHGHGISEGTSVCLADVTTTFPDVDAVGALLDGIRAAEPLGRVHDPYVTAYRRRELRCRRGR
jgi:hypothetical protein